MATTKKSLWMINLLSVFLLALLLPVSALANGGGEGTSVTVAGYSVSLIFDAPAKTGENSFHLQILDAMGMPVNNAQVEISAIPVIETVQHQALMSDASTQTNEMGNMNAPEATATPENSMSVMSGMGASESTATPDSMSGMSGMSASDPTATPDSMSGMDVMSSTASAAENDTILPGTVSVLLAKSTAAGEYEGQIAFASSGHWMVNVHLSINGQSLEAVFPLEIPDIPSGKAILAGFAGLNVIILAAAAISKRKTAVRD